MSNSSKQYAKIRIGSIISQDFSQAVWPNCKPPMSEYAGSEYEYITKFPDRVFQVEQTENYFVLTADGYGFHKPHGEYGNGSICVESECDLEFLHSYEESAEFYKNQVQVLQNEIAVLKAKNANLQGKLDVINSVLQ